VSADNPVVLRGGHHAFDLYHSLRFEAVNALTASTTASYGRAVSAVTRRGAALA
jgi:hypothetical protein